ncbi:MAG: hypothetical protein KGI38_10065 [Thaumarchaeota archaeon]|nr:hypothetical protein [Nitrososphaerota archaeon]
MEQATVSGNQKTPKETLYGFYVVVIGLAVATFAFSIALYRYTSAQDLATAIGPITTLIGTLVGAFFGQQVGSAGKEKAHRTALKLALKMKTPLTDQEIRELDM